MNSIMRLHDYLRRVGIPPPLERNSETLRRLHFAHRKTFLFENLSIQTGSGISLALPDLERKFLDDGRGGYCFEHNTLFASVLGELGIASTTLLGRVRRGPREQRTRTHMVLRVPIDDDVWMADVGFGALGLLEPLPLRQGASSDQGGLTYTLRREHALWVLSMRDRTSTMDLYEFTEEPQTPWDVEVANHFTSTHRDSPFRRSLTIQRSNAEERTTLRNELLSRYRAGQLTEESIDRSKLQATARDLFDLELPSGPFVYESDRVVDPRA
jgi:N-hydroxyarylamine O-acetyltransferase